MTKRSMKLFICDTSDASMMMVQTQSNRVQLVTTRETTMGTTPGSPRMRKMRMTGESLAFSPSYVTSDEIRPDRMNVAPILVMKDSAGGINLELSYPDDNSPFSDILRSAFEALWVNTPTFFNDGTADSVITDAGTTSNTYVVVSGGAAVVAGHLVRATGFGNSANNQIFRAATGSGTTIVGTSLSLSAETAPAAAAKLKVIGFQGASADITATSTGLASTVLDFTTLGLAVGQWLKIGATAAGNRFATAALNDWVRITAIAAHALSCDNLPTGWTTDAGTGKTVIVYFGDTIKNGTTQTSMTIERGFLGQTTPVYIVNVGMNVNSLAVTINSRAKITAAAAFIGMGGSESTSALSGSPDATTVGAVMAANANVGRLAENGSRLTSPNWAKNLEFTINNNLRTIESVDSQSPVAVRDGECTVTGKIDTYFGDDTILAKFYNNTLTSLNSRVAKNSQALVWQFPAVTLNSGGNPQATAKNVDVMVSCDWVASIDTLTNANCLLDRLEYYET